jgi:hypothetical protein
VPASAWQTLATQLKNYYIQCMGEPAKTIEYPRYCSLEEYFKLSAESLEKLEFRGNKSFPLRGEVVAM